MIIARTDAAAVLGIGEAIERANCFERIGADVLFVEAPRGKEELERIGKAAKGWKMANMLEGGATPILRREVLDRMGYKIVAYPLTLISSAIKAMENALVALKADNPNNVIPLLKSFEETKEVAGFPEYHKLERKYGLARESSLEKLPKPASVPEEAQTKR